MSFQVDIHKTVRSAQRNFALDVSFRTTAQRSVIYGPSGAGKSLTLQALAGLLRPDRGRITFGDQVLFDGAAGINIPARQRQFGYLFQDYALFPHLNVRQNIGFGLTHGLRNPSAAARDQRVDHWMEAFELTELAAQRPAELSGGQRQRTALARALIHAPQALLLDEPFSALDPALRERMRSELDQLLRRIDIPVLMITHDPDDLARFGEETFHLHDGVIASAPADSSNRGKGNQG